MRRQFQLPEADELYLKALGLPWETVLDAKVQWLIVHDRPVPVGYNHGKAMAAVMIAPGYPDAQIDMVYFFPHLARADGGIIKNLTSHRFDDTDWQRWSRHRTQQNPWRAVRTILLGILSLLTTGSAGELAGIAA